MQTHNDIKTDEQISECLKLLNDVLGKDLLGVYLCGSAVAGGVGAFSDIDLFVVSNRETTGSEKAKLARELLKISGVYQKSQKRPVELTIVVKSQVNPWAYPPYFDFQYGDWLREEFETGNVEPWPNKEMPDLALLITQILLASKTLMGPPAKQLLREVPYRDVIVATKDALSELMENFENDTRNVLLTLARMWAMLMTDVIHSKPAAALWALEQLPDEHKPALVMARAIYLGQGSENWKGNLASAKVCAEYMKEQVEKRLTFLKSQLALEHKLRIQSSI